MTDIFKTLRGYARIEVTGAFPESVLNACAENAVEFWSVESVDAFTLRCTVPESDVQLVKSLTVQSMCDMKLLNTRGGRAGRKMLHRRRFLIIALAAVTALMAWSSLYIWDIEVTGCRQLTRGEVLRLLEDNGVTVGTYWPGINADTVRSRVILHDERIAWMTVNVRSSKAYVVIHERLETPELINDSTVCDLVAGQNGVVKKLSVLSGQPQVSAGQAVYKGDVLVSGTVESITNPARNVHAYGEVWCDTWYELCAKTPAQILAKTHNGQTHSRFALIIGEKRINFCRSSRNDDDKCDKIIHTYKCAIDGVFTLPVTLVREEYIPFESEEAVCSDESISLMCERLFDRLDGVQYSSTEAYENDGAITVKLRAQCLEDIAVARVRD